MASFQELTLIGNLGHDPELRYTPAGDAVLRFSIAVNHKIRGRDGQQDREETQWFNITVWRAFGEELNKWLEKGMLVLVKGRLRLRTYERQDGSPGHSLDVVAQTVRMLGGGRRREEGEGVRGEREVSLGDGDYDDIPF